MLVVAIDVLFAAWLAPTDPPFGAFYSEHLNGMPVAAGLVARWYQTHYLGAWTFQFGLWTRQSGDCGSAVWAVLYGAPVSMLLDFVRHLNQVGALQNFSR